MARRVEQAIILAGGEGTRLRPLTSTRPKPLLPVLGVPCIEYVIRAMAAAGVKHIFLACGYRSEDVRNALGRGDRFGVKLELACEREPMGTAGAVKLLEDRLDGTFVVGSGDTMMDAELGPLIDFHLRRGAEATIGLTEVERPEQFGIVGVSAEGRVERFKEKPRPEEVFSRVINAGIYVLEPEVLRMVPPARKYDFAKDLYVDMLARGRGLFAAPINGYWRDIGRPGDLYLANMEMASRRPASMAPAGVDAEGPCHFGEGVRASSSRVRRSVIGRACVLDASLVDGCLLLDRTSVGRGAEVRGCILGEGCRIGAGAMLRDCVLGDGVTVSPGKALEGTNLEAGAAL
ncbi:MAG TPA: NDP-sugar synthase [Methanomassiliicoccales archaeon]|mgnify:FL=1|nr:NDP-sugar synthase [Methanomassiliicoccales archaeon]